jgi:hypothetical protein
MGDLLDPNEITELLKIVPTMAYKKNEPYFVGKRTGTLKGKTGVWLFSTNRGIQSTNFYDHLNAVVALLALDHFEGLLKEASNPKPRSSHIKIAPLPQFLLRGRLKSLHALLEQKTLTASISCFWYGTPGAQPPSVHRLISSLLKLVPITIETDFDTDEDGPARGSDLRASA